MSTRERYAPGTRVMFEFPDGSSAPGTITHYYSVSTGLVHIAFDRGDTWLGATSRVHILSEYPWCDIYPDLAKGSAPMMIEEFIEARIAEDEQIARSAIDPERPGTHWCWEDGERDPLQPGVEVEELDTQAISLRTVEEYPTRPVGPLPAFILRQVEARLPGGLWHIARHDPARVLRQCAALRATVAYIEAMVSPSQQIEAEGDVLYPIAAIWSDHPEFREE